MPAQLTCTWGYGIKMSAIERPSSSVLQCHGVQISRPGPARSSQPHDMPVTMQLLMSLHFPLD